MIFDKKLSLSVWQKRLCC